MAGEVWLAWDPEAEAILSSDSEGEEEEGVEKKIRRIRHRSADCDECVYCLQRTRRARWTLLLQSFVTLHARR